MLNESDEIMRILLGDRYRLSDGRDVGSVTTKQLRDYYDHLETSLGGCVGAELFVTNLADIEAQLNLCWYALKHQVGEAP